MRDGRTLLVVVSAPSGAGKTTLCERLLSEHGDFVYSVSCTTRPPRGAEVNGRDYHFLTPLEFECRLADGEFLEHASVHGYRYGTLVSTVRQGLAAGRHVLMDIDVQGARQIRAHIEGLPPDDPMRRGFVDIFIAPPSIDVLRQRLEARGEDDAETIARRVANAEREMADRELYQHVIVNDDLDTAYRQLKEAVEGARNSHG